MSPHTTEDPLDEVPEADALEQQTPVEPELDEDEDAPPWDIDPDKVDEEKLEADEADLLEQHTPVPAVDEEEEEV
jgi:hypothetical protein